MDRDGAIRECRRSLRDARLSSAGSGCAVGGGCRRYTRTALRQADCGDRRAGEIPAVSRMDSAECNGGRRVASHGEVWVADSRQASDCRWYRTFTARGGGVLAEAWRGNPDDL